MPSTVLLHPNFLHTLILFLYLIRPIAETARVHSVRVNICAKCCTAGASIREG